MTVWIWSLFFNHSNRSGIFCTFLKGVNGWRTFFLLMHQVNPRQMYPNNASDFNNLFCFASIDSSIVLNNDIVQTSLLDSCVYIDEDQIRRYDNRDFSLFHINARSLWKKFDNVHHFLSGNEVCVAAITETWLHENTPSNLITIPSYNFVHKIRGNKRGGGV